MQPIVWLPDQLALDPALVGPKAAGLARLVAAGLPVPAGFVLTVAAERAHLAGTPAEAALVDLLVAFRERRLWRREAIMARAALASTPFQERILGPLHEAYQLLTAGGVRLVAVRSSALLEDGDTASFAGQLSTLLGVAGFDQLVAAVRSCWSARWGDGVLGYAEQRGVDPAAGGMGVLVQATVNPEAAGTALSHDPANGAEVLLVNAAWGLGRAVAEGEVTPDFWRLDPSGRILEARTGHKPLAARLDAAVGERWEPLSAAQANAPCLEPEQLAELARLVARVAVEFGSPREVEWALAGGKLWLLQARPLAIGIQQSAPESAPRLDAVSETLIAQLVADEQSTQSPPWAPQLGWSAAVAQLLEAADGRSLLELLGPWLEAGASLRGQPASPGRAVGRARLLLEPADARRARPGDVLIATALRPSTAALVPLVAGLVAEAGGTTSHSANLARERRIPAVLGTRGAAREIPDGALVLVDGTLGQVWWRVPTRSTE